MAEYGQILGAYYIFSGFFKLGSMLFNGPPAIISINDTANIFGQEPSYRFLEDYPEAGTYNVVPSLVQLYQLQLILFCCGGLLSLLTVFCFYQFAAYSLYVLTWIYAVVYFITHAHILQSYQSEHDVILDNIPAFRGQSEYQVLFFGELKWPDSFWYQFAAQMIFKIYMVYLVSDLYYSWYLILKAGGSGWELLPANELPGWERYQAKERQKLEARDQERGAPANAAGDMPQIGPEDLETLLRLLQQGGGAAGRFGDDIPPQLGIPVRQ